MRPPTGKLLCTLVVTTALTACANMGPPQPPSLELPKPPTDLRAARKGDKVVLTWTRPTMTTDRQRLQGPVPMRICRTLTASISQCGTPVGQFVGGAMLAGASSSATNPPQSLDKKKNEARITDAYTDALRNRLIPAGNQPALFATYAVETINVNGRTAGLSNQVRVPLMETLPPPRNFAAKVSDQGVAMTWTAASLPQGADGVHYVYRVYRRSQYSGQQLLVGELPAGGQQEMTLTDGNIEWEQTYFYHAEAVTVLDKDEIQVEGDDTSEVKVFTHDVFPPAVPSGLQAVLSGPGQAAFIDLIWAPVTDADLSGYNVYRREENGTPVRVNEEVVKVPAYRDMKVGAGKTYFYSVSAVDLRGNESARSGEAGESVLAD